MIKVYGASDDLVEVEGDIEEEFNVIHDGEIYLGFSTGHAFTIRYDDDEWVFKKKSDGNCDWEVYHIGSDLAENDYTETLVIHGDVGWVVCGKDFAQ